MYYKIALLHFGLQKWKKWKFRTFRTLAKSGRVTTRLDRLDTVILSRAKVGTRFCTFEKWNSRNFREFHENFTDFSAKIVFVSSKVADGADRSGPFKNQWNIATFSSPGSSKVTFSLKSHFFAKSDLWTQKSKKWQKLILDGKVAF